MRLKHIETFHALMMAGSVVGAARLLHVSPPAVSKTLSHAEQVLGFPLYHRIKGRLKPTAEALALYTEVVKIPPQLETLKTLAIQLKAAGGQRLRIATVPALAQHLLPWAVAGLRHQGLAVTVEVRARHSQDLVPTLLLRQADLGVDFDFGEHPAIERTILMETGLVCVAPPGWFSTQTPLTTADFSARPSVGYYPGDPLGERLGPYQQQGGSAIQVDTYSAAAGFASSGVAAAIVDPFTAASYAGLGSAICHLAIPLPLRLSVFTLRDRPVCVADVGFRAAVRDAATGLLYKIDAGRLPATSLFQ